MAISFVAAGTVVTGANPTVTVPTGYAQGDLLVIITTGTATPTTPSGWTQRAAQAATGFVTILYKFATGSEASVAVTLAGTTSKAVMLAYRGVSANDTISTFSTASATTLATNTLTTTYANEYVISVYGSNGGSAATWTAPASTISRVNSASTLSIAGLLVVDEGKATAGVTTARTATVSASRALSAVAFSIIPSGRFWVTGGTNTWSTTNTGNWAFASGGASGAPVPTAQDDVTFDGGTIYTVTCTGALTCKNFTASGTGAPSFVNGTSPTFAISGSFSNTASSFTWSTTGLITFNSTSTGRTIATNNVALSSSVTFNGTGGGWTLSDLLSVGSNLTFTAGTVSAGTASNITSTTSLTVNGGTVSFGTTSVSSGSFSLSSGTVNLDGSICQFTSATPVTITGGTLGTVTSSSVYCTADAFTFAGGGKTFGTVGFLGVSVTSIPLTSVAVTGANTFGALQIGDGTARATPGITTVTFSANQTITSDFYANAGTTNPTSRLFLVSDTVGTARTLSIAGTSGVVGLDFRDITVTGAAAPLTGTSLGNCKGNSGITFSTAKTVYWNLAGNNNWSATGWATSSGGTPAAANFPLAQDTAVFDNTGSASGTTTIEAAYNIGTVDMSGRTSAMTLSASGAPTIYGNWTNGTGLTTSGTGRLTFSGRTTQVLTGAGISNTFATTLNSPSGTLQLFDAWTSSGGSTAQLTLTNGTLDLNGKTYTIGGAGSQTLLTAAGTKNITFNGGSIVFTSNSASLNQFNNAAPTGFTTTAGTGTGTISMNGVLAKTFTGGGSTFNCTLNQGGAGALTITGANTFNDITNTYGATGATSILFTAGTTSTFTNWSASGTVGNLLTIASVTAATHTLSKASGTVNASYLSLTNSIATGGATWNAINSTNGGGNTGWIFSTSSGSTGNFFLMF